MWPNASVDDRINPKPALDASGNPLRNSKGKVMMMSASEWLAKHRSIEALTWDPGKPEFIHDCVVVDGGYIDKPGATTLNFYRPPPKIELGDAAQATRWVKHWHALYPNDAEHIIAWFACRVQRPGEKINHALVLGGAPKIGKDTLLEGVAHTVGEWNFQTIKLNHLVSKNNGFLKTLIVRLSEARDLSEHGAVNLYRLNDHMKDMLAAPPNTLRINEKYINEYYILNRFGLVTTTNYRDALCLPDDDRRHYVGFSERRGEEFPKEFWNEFWGWYETGGFAHVAALLYQHDLSNFDPKAEPPKTDAFWYMVNANRNIASGELADVIDELGNPPALTIAELSAKAPHLEWLHNDQKHKLTGYRLADCHYVRVNNRDAKDKLWKINGRRQVIYVQEDLTPQQRETAALAHKEKLTTQKETKS
jgi:alkylated DNA repair dioxygenase AlkB